MIVKTEAVVLKSMKYGDTSRIVTLYTREFGKLSVIAKGARGPKAKFGAALDIMSRCDVVMYRKEHRDLHLISQADLIQQYRGVIGDPVRLMSAFAVLEFLYATVQGEEGHDELYDLLVDSLDRMDVQGSIGQLELSRFLVGLSAALGVGFDMEHCVNCRVPLDQEGALRDRVAFSTAYGGCTCAICSPKADSMQISRETVSLLHSLRSGGNAGATSVSHRLAQEAVQLLYRHLSAHIDGMRRVKSMKMLDAFDGGS